MNAFVDKIPGGSSKRKGQSCQDPTDIPKKSKFVSKLSICHKHDVNLTAQNRGTKTVQMYLDFGQRSFGKQVECKICSMRYVQGDVEDEAKHKAFCSFHSNGFVSFPSFFKENIDFFVKQTFTSPVPLSGDANQPKSNCFSSTSQPSSSSSSSSKQKESPSTLKIIALSLSRLRSDTMMKLYDKIFSELNSDSSFTLPEIDEMSEYQQEDDVSLSKTTDDRAGCFICIDDRRRILGCVIVEKLWASNNVLRLRDDQQVSEILFDSTAASSREKSPLSSPPMNSSTRSASDLYLGVRQLWVHKSCRRTGISKRLIDAARRYFMYGDVFSKEKVAFSQPTDDGRAFAFSYAPLESDTGSFIWIYPG